jgi:hypothetical protein
MNSEKKSISVIIQDNSLLLLTLVCVILKFSGVINWSWLWVLAPTWIPAGLAVSILSIIPNMANKIERYTQYKYKKNKTKAQIKIFDTAINEDKKIIEDAPKILNENTVTHNEQRIEELKKIHSLLSDLLTKKQVTENIEKKKIR